MAGRKFLIHKNLGTLFDIFLTSFPPARELLRQGHIISQVKGAPLRCGLSEINSARAGNLLATGETISTTFPFSGEGIGKAMESAEIAAGIIDNYLRTGNHAMLDSYPLWLASKLESKYAAYRTAEKYLTKPWIGDFIAYRAKRSRFLQKSLAGMINETVDPKSVFSFSGLVRSLLT